MSIGRDWKLAHPDLAAKGCTAKNFLHLADFADKRIAEYRNALELIRGDLKVSAEMSEAAQDAIGDERVPFEPTREYSPEEAAKFLGVSK